MRARAVELVETIHESARTTILRVRRPDGTTAIVKLPAAEHPSARDVEILERELALLRRAAGPGVGRALGLEEIGSKPALVLEDGPHRRLPGEALALGAFLHVAVELTRALARVHAAGLVHGDVNPSNVVWRESDGDVRLIDFGIAFEPMDAQAAQARGLTGTVEFIAPEQTGRTSRGVDHRADLYSLGATFYLWLSGRLPFSEGDAIGYVHAHMSKPAPRLTELAAVPEVLARIVARLLAKEPEARYQRADSLLADLETCQRYFAESGAIPGFEIAAHDRLRRLTLPSALVERAAALEVLTTARRGLVVVSGAVGAGKSAVLDEARRVRAGSGAVIAVRCTTAMEAVPLAGIAAVLAAIADQALVQSSAVLEARRAAWTAAVAPNGAVLVEIEPRFGAVLGPQPRVAELGPREADLRCKQTVEALFRALASAGELAVVVDDAEWLDAQSSHALLQLAAHRIAGLAVILAAERDRAERLASDAAGVGLGGADVQRVALAPISQPALAAMFARLIERTGADVDGLARAVHAKTGGNPLVIAELLERIQDDRLLAYDAPGSAWRWDDDAIWALPVCGSAVEIVVERLATLRPACRAVLEVAACLGMEVDVAALRAVLPASAEVDAGLAEAEAHRVVLPARGGVRAFAHRGVWEAVHAAIPDPRRAVHHLAIARCAAARDAGAMPALALLSAVRHYRAAGELVTALEERRAVAGLEREAARRARAAAGYAVAAEHLEHALGLLGSGEWEGPGDRFAVARNRVECIALSGDLVRAHALGVELLASAPGPLERARVHSVVASVLSSDNKLLETIETIRAGLGELGIALPSEPAAIQAAIGAGLGRMQAHLAQASPRALAALPEMRDASRMQAMELLFLLVPAAFQIGSPLFVLAELMMFELATEHGVVASSAKNFVDCAILQVKVFRDHARALEFADAAFALIERFHPTPFASAVKFVYGAFVAQWRADPSAIIDVFDDGQREGAALGDTLHAMCCAAWRCLLRRYMGTPLRACLADLEATIVYGGATGAAIQRANAEHEAIVVRALMRADGDGGGGDGWLVRAEAFAPMAAAAAWQSELMRRYVMRDRAGVRAALVRVTELEDAGDGLLSQGERVLFQALAQIERVSDAASREAARVFVDAATETLRGWAELNPGFFTGFHRLADAERCRLIGSSPVEVAARYDAVVDDPACRALHLKAIACERQAEYWLERGRKRLARPLLREAYTFYERWGAEAKLHQLVAAYPAELGAMSRATRTASGRTHDTTTATTASDVQVDVDSAVKAVTAISSEVKPERLFAVLLKTILENAGAQRGCLISVGDGMWIEARAATAAPADLTRVRLEDAPAIARDVVRYAARTRTDVILADAGDDERFRRDPHLSGGGVRAVLCMPIVAAGELRGLLYVENNAVAGAFTSRHIRMLRIIAGQAATSIENARVYERLEDIVRARTGELASKNREMAVLLDNLPQGVFTLGDDLRVEAGFSARLPALLGVDAVAGRSAQALLFDGCDLPAETLASHEQALLFSFGAERFLAELNWGALIRSFQRRTASGDAMFEIDWASIVDDHDRVVRILATVRDVTQLRALERRLETASQEAAIIDEVLGAGLDAFHGYCGDARARLAQCRAALAARAAIAPAVVTEVFRQLHTLKGNARMLGLASVSRTIHTEEEPYAQLLARGAGARETSALADGVERLAAFLADRAAIVSKRLGDPSRSHAAVASAALEAIAAEIRQAQRAPGEAQPALRRIAAVLRAATQTPLAEVVRKAGRVFSSLAAELAKPVPELVIDADDVQVDPAMARVITDALVHVFRNALDHGIEPPDQRARGGKPAAGRVHVAIRALAGDLRIAIGDDGRGLNLSRLREHAAPGADDAAVAESIFRSGLSTAHQVTDISGRGVGMDAVRSFVSELGGRVDVAFTGPERDGLRPFELVFHLPGHADAGADAA